MKEINNMHGYYPHDYVDENFYTKEEVERLLSRFHREMVVYVKENLARTDCRTYQQVLDQFVSKNITKG